MPWTEVEYVRKRAKASDRGPWVDYPGEMARKTVLRRLIKRLPKSNQLEAAVVHEQAMELRDRAIPETVTAPSSRVIGIQSRLGMRREAEASVALDHDEEMGTQVVTNVGPDQQDRAKEIAREHAQAVAEQAATHQMPEGSPPPTAGPGGGVEPAEAPAATRLCSAASPYGGGEMCELEEGHTRTHRAGNAETW